MCADDNVVSSRRMLNERVWVRLGARVCECGWVKRLQKESGPAKQCRFDGGPPKRPGPLCGVYTQHNAGAIYRVLGEMVTAPYTALYTANQMHGDGMLACRCSSSNGCVAKLEMR